MGFSTGQWQGNILTVHTTHIKQGWHRRNGLPSSDLIDLVEHFIVHDGVLTHVTVATDPIYLEEPMIKSQEYAKGDNTGGNWLWPCEYVEELPGADRTHVQSFPPGENPFLNEFAAKRNIPLEAALGGAKTMYPEYMETMPRR
jgi:hypothetical protein